MSILFTIVPCCIVPTFLFFGNRFLSLCVSVGIVFLSRLGGIIIHSNALSLMSFCIVNDVLAALLNLWLFIARVAIVSNSDKLLLFRKRGSTTMQATYITGKEAQRAILLFANPPVRVRIVCYFDNLVLDKGDFVVSGCFIRVVRNDYFSCLFCEHISINQSSSSFPSTYQTLYIVCLYQYRYWFKRRKRRRKRENKDIIVMWSFL